jgi:hypothetical protein
MRYSDLAQMIDTINSFGAPPPDPFALSWPRRLCGLDVIVAPSVPRYTLPEEVIPGVPWPPGFRDEINRWSRSYLGTVDMIPRGTAYLIGGSRLVMRPADVVKLTNLC